MYDSTVGWISTGNGGTAKLNTESGSINVVRGAYRNNVEIQITWEANEEDR